MSRRPPITAQCRASCPAPLGFARGHRAARAIRPPCCDRIGRPTAGRVFCALLAFAVPDSSKKIWTLSRRPRPAAASRSLRRARRARNSAAWTRPLARQAWTMSPRKSRGMHPGRGEVARALLALRRVRDGGWWPPGPELSIRHRRRLWRSHQRRRGEESRRSGRRCGESSGGSLRRRWPRCNAERVA